MGQQKKESYAEPLLVAHELLRDLTGNGSAVKGRDKAAEKAGSEGPF